MGTVFLHFVLIASLLFKKILMPGLTNLIKNSHFVINQSLEFRIIKTHRDMNSFHVNNGHCILTLCLDCEFIISKNSHARLRSHIKNSCFVFHQSNPNTSKQWPRVFISFSVFGYSNETLALVVDILRKNPHIRT